MDAFSQELMDRSPLADAALSLLDFAFDRDLLQSLFGAHRGRCYDDVLGFPDLITLVHRSLLEHGGSAHRLFLDLERDGSHPVDESNFYRKLARTPAALSEALLSSCAARLGSVMPDTGRAELPGCFDAFTVVAGDGKKVKRVAKRLLPTRGVSGSLLGAKALVAVDLRTGLGLAMSTDLDGQANDVPLVPGLVGQLHAVVDGPMLSVWDRQFSDTATMRRLGSRGGDRFVVRIRKGLGFDAKTTASGPDSDGVMLTDEVGVFGRTGTGERAPLAVRRITKLRPGQDPIIIVTDLMDIRAYPAADLMSLYRRRWGIEEVFQQVTETFGLGRLIGCTPKAVLLQLSVCLVLYNLLQVIRAHVADDAKMLTAAVSMHYLFDHTRRQLLAWAYHAKGQHPDAPRDPMAMLLQLQARLAGAFDTNAYAKRPDTRTRPQRPPPQQVPGGHSSVQRLLDAAKTT